MLRVPLDLPIGLSPSQFLLVHVFCGQYSNFNCFPSMGMDSNWSRLIHLNWSCKLFYEFVHNVNSFILKSIYSLYISSCSSDSNPIHLTYALAPNRTIVYRLRYVCGVETWLNFSVVRTCGGRDLMKHFGQVSRTARPNETFRRSLPLVCDDARHLYIAASGCGSADGLL